MHYQTLGQSSLNVSRYALGCWPFAGGKVWGDQDDAVSIATVHAALAAGINFFDTAEGYENGHSERVLGQALVGRRDQAIIATKVSANHLAPADVFAACEQSLHNLQTDYIDLYFIHWPNWEIPLAETVGALEQLKQQGKIRAIGVCNFGVRDLSDILELYPVVTDQLPYNLLWRTIEPAILPLCRANEVGLMCYSPLAQGLLTGRYRTADDVPSGLSRTRHYSSSRPQSTHSEPGCEAELFAALAGVKQIAKDLGQPMAAVALAWVRQQPGVATILVGARTPEEVQLNLPALELELSQDVIQALNVVTEPVKHKLGDNPDMWMSPSRTRELVPITASERAILTTIPRPNLLYIHSDQHNPFVTGCYGDPLVATPHLDRLAGAGAIFDAAYCTSPICVPSRMSMLTGLHPCQHQVWTNRHVLHSGIPTFAHALGAAGYRSVLAGRMHVRGPDQLHGYADRLVGDHMPNHLGGPMPQMGILTGTETPVRKTLTTSGPGQVAYQLHDEEVTAAAVGFLDQIGRERRAGLTPAPFSLTVGFMLPHPPYVPRRVAFDRYRSRVTLPRKPRPFAAETHPYLRRWRSHTGSESVTEEEALNTRAAYWALVAEVDTMVGQILAALQANNLSHETLVIYTSDHGDMMGEHGLWWKHTFYEESVRVPLIMAWPGVITPGTRCGRVVSALDVNATILDALDAPTLPNSPGNSLLGLVAHAPAGAGRGSSAWEDFAFAEYCEDQYSPPGGAYQRMVRRGRWKLIDYDQDPPQLFDLEADPDELVDRAADPACAALLHELRATIRAGWDPDQIRAKMAAMDADNRILEAWAGKVNPAEQYRWSARAEK